MHMPQNSRYSFDEMTKDVSLGSAAAQYSVLDRDHQDKAKADGKSLIFNLHALLQGLSPTQVCLEESSR